MVEAYAKTAGKFTLWFQMFKLAAMLKTNAGQKRKLRGSQNQQRSMVDGSITLKLDFLALQTNTHCISRSIVEI